MFKELRSYGPLTVRAIFAWCVKGEVTTSEGRVLQRFDGVRSRLDFMWFALRRHIREARAESKAKDETLRIRIDLDELPKDVDLFAVVREAIAVGVAGQRDR